MSTILVPYMQHFLGWQRNRAEGVFHDFVAAAYAMTVVGAWLSDRFFGRYRIILWLSYGYVAGHATLAAMDAMPSARTGLLFAGMTLIVVGQAGIKPNLSAFVGDQFRQDQAGLLDRVYSLFYVAINIGSAASQIATPWLLAGCAFGAPSSASRPRLPGPSACPASSWRIALVIYLAGSRQALREGPSGGPRPNSFGAVLRHAPARAKDAAGRGGTARGVDGSCDRSSASRWSSLPTVTFWALYFQYGRPGSTRPSR